VNAVFGIQNPDNLNHVQPFVFEYIIAGQHTKNPDVFNAV
jgi:hypothetical protein